jgi:hypothetical protein
MSIDIENMSDDELDDFNAKIVDEMMRRNQGSDPVVPDPELSDDDIDDLAKRVKDILGQSKEEFEIKISVPLKIVLKDVLFHMDGLEFFNVVVELDENSPEDGNEDLRKLIAAEINEYSIGLNEIRDLAAFSEIADAEKDMMRKYRDAKVEVIRIVGRDFESADPDEVFEEVWEVYCNEVYDS